MSQREGRVIIERRERSITAAVSRRLHLKMVSAICLCVLTGFLFVPIDGGIVYHPRDDEVSLATLDVCHTGSSAVYGNPDMPSLYQNPHDMATPEFLCVLSLKNPTLKPFLAVFENDRPPQS